MARRLLRAGFSLLVHDIDATACSRLGALGARVASGPAEIAAQAPVVFLCLPSPAITDGVAEQLVAEGTSSALRVLVETSTVGLQAIRGLAARLAPRGVDVLDAPVSGGPGGAEAGRLAVMYAGSDRSAYLAMPALRALAGRLVHMGEEPGMAQVCKLVNNAISAAGMIAACQAMVLGVKAGLDAASLLEAVNAGSGRNAATLEKFPGPILSGRFDFGGPMGLMLKDLGLYLALAQAEGVPATLAQATLDVWTQAVARCGPQADYTRVICPLEEDAGVQVRAARLD